MSNTTDKRRHLRPMARLDVRLAPAPGQDLPPGLQAVTVDVAVGGVRCACNLPLEPQTILRLTLTLVGGDLRQPHRGPKRSGLPGQIEEGTHGGMARRRDGLFVARA